MRLAPLNSDTFNSAPTHTSIISRLVEAGGRVIISAQIYAPTTSARRIYVYLLDLDDYSIVTNNLALSEFNSIYGGGFIVLDNA